jgi:hypothetical protein
MEATAPACGSILYVNLSGALAAAAASQRGTVHACRAIVEAAENVSKCGAQGKHTRYHVSDVACCQEFLHFSCYVLGVVLVFFVEKVVVDNGFALVPCAIQHQHE